MPAVPPIETRFKPGESGNPNGRPKGTLNLTNLLRDKLSELAEGDNKYTYADLLVRKTLAKAIKDGDASLIKYCFDRLDGMPMQQTDITSGGKELPTPIIQLNK